MRANKWGKFRIVRFLIVGWTLQSVHVLDRTEQLFRVVFEAMLFAVCVLFYSLLKPDHLKWLDCIVVFVSVHTLMFLFDSPALVGLRECLSFVRNPGIHKTIAFLLLTEDIICSANSVKCVLVYGSMARGMFHDRSDLDVRVVRRAGFWSSLRVLFIAIWLRTVATWRYCIPLDLKVVDSMNFLREEMRSDEKPLVVYCRAGFEISDRGFVFNEVVGNPTMVLKSANVKEKESACS